MPPVLKALLVVVAAVAACLLSSAALLLKGKWLPRRCPRCRWRALKDVAAMHATCVDPQGRRHSKDWTDFKCGNCHVLFRQHVGGRLEELPPVER